MVKPSGKSLKTQEKLEKMRVASALVAQCLDQVESIIKPGITTDTINDFCVEFLRNRGAVAGTLNYCGFPKSLCVSINEQVCHGIPGEKIIKEGDIVKLDFVVRKDGYYGDSCRCYLVGKCSEKSIKLRKICYEAMWAGIQMVKPGVAINAIGTKIEDFARNHGFSSVRDFCGHGIGEEMHMDPQMPHFDTKINNKFLKQGMFFTIEPMLNAGTHKVKILEDNWTVVTEDKELSAQWEHTIYVTPTGYEVLTLSSREKQLMEEGSFNFQLEDS